MTGATNRGSMLTIFKTKTKRCDYEKAVRVGSDRKLIGRNYVSATDRGGHEQVEVIPQDADELKELILSYSHMWRTYNGKRNNENCTGITALLLDFDDGVTISQFEKSKLANYEHVLYSSRNHKKLKNGKQSERFHVAFPVVITNLNKAERAQNGLMQLALLEGLTHDVAAKDFARLFYPSRAADFKGREPENFVFKIGGSEAVTEDTFLKYAVAALDKNIKQNAALVQHSDKKLASAVESLKEVNASQGLNYADWVTIAASLHDIEGGYKAFCELSLSYPGATQHEVDRKWQQTENMHSITSATFYYKAIEHGWEYIESIAEDRGEDVRWAKHCFELEQHYKKQYDADMLSLGYIGAKLSFIGIRQRFGKVTIQHSEIPAHVIAQGLTSADMRREFKDFLVKHRTAMRPPSLQLRAGLKTFSESKAEELMQSKDDIVIEHRDKFDGALKVKIPFSLPDNGGDAGYVLAVLKEIFSTGNEDYLPQILKFMAQFVFEHRIGAKPVLVLAGGRNTGKSFFLEHILGAIFADSIRSYSNKDNFHYWKQALKIISVEESGEQKGDLKALYNDIKDYSGSTLTMVNLKGRDVVYKETSAYFCVATNNLVGGFWIGDKRSSTNQFLVCEFTDKQDKDKSSTWKSLDVTPIKIKDNLRAFIRQILYPLYKNDILPNRNKNRYGFEVKRTGALSKLENNSMSRLESDFNSVLEYIEEVAQAGILIGGFETEYNDHFYYFKNNNFLSNKLLEAICKEVGVRLSKKHFQDGLRQAGFSGSEASDKSIRKIKGTSYRGIVTNVYEQSAKTMSAYNKVLKDEIKDDDDEVLF